MLVTRSPKAHDFVFDRQAIAWADPFDRRRTWAAIRGYCGSRHGFFVGMRDIARYLLRMLRCIAMNEDRHWVITVLLCQHAEINGARINTRWSTGFQTADTQRQFTQTA